MRADQSPGHQNKHPESRDLSTNIRQIAGEVRNMSIIINRERDYWYRIVQIPNSGRNKGILPSTYCHRLIYKTSDYNDLLGRVCTLHDNTYRIYNKNKDFTTYIEIKKRIQVH